VPVFVSACACTCWCCIFVVLITTFIVSRLRDRVVLPVRLVWDREGIYPLPAGLCETIIPHLDH
jgi:hypothetical protein